MTASELVDFASRDPVRRRFRLDDDDLARLEEWIAGAGIRWGLDAAHRLPFQLDSCAENTWRAGLDRLLLGVTMAEEDLRLVGGVLPLDDVDSGDIDLAGRLAELVDRVDSATTALRTPQPIGGWVDAIASAADALTATSQRDAWQRDELDRLLADLVDESALGGHAARPRRGPQPARRPPAGTADAGQLPHRAPDDVHARADALGAAPRGVPARPRRRRVPAAHGARRRRHHRARPVRRRPRRPQRGPPAPPRRPAGGDRPPRRHVLRARRAHQRRAPARRAARRAARRHRRHGAHRRRCGAPARRRRASAADLRRPQLRRRRARRRSPSTVELRRRRSRRCAGPTARAADRIAVPPRAPRCRSTTQWSSSTTWFASSSTR